MRKFSTFEKVFLTLGSVLALGGAFLFFFQAEQLGVMFGFLVESQKNPMGHLEYSVASTRRKPFAGQNFLALNHQQKVFDRDTVMTDDSSEAVFSLNDGGMINLGPNTLVELISREPSPLEGGAPQIILNVKKGEVTGVSGGKKILIVKDGKTSELPTTKPASLLSEVVTKDKTELKKECVVKFNVKDGHFSATGSLLLNIVPFCDGEPEPNAKISILTASRKPVITNQAIPGEVQFEAPGTYFVKWENALAEEQSITIPAEWPGIVFASNTLDCASHLQWNLDASVPTQKPLYLIQSAKLSQKNTPPVEGNQLTSDGLFSGYPASLQIKTVPTPQGFSWFSPVFDIKHLPACNELVSPANDSILKKTPGSFVVFAWKQKDGQEQVRFELSDKPDFKSILNSQLTEHNYARAQISRKGSYYWRVVDVTSGESSPSFHFLKQH